VVSKRGPGGIPRSAERRGVMDATEARESTPETPNQAAAKTSVRHRGPTDPPWYSK
jgi:hypothetical protein